MIRSFEGKVAQRFAEYNLFVSSPNMAFVPPPPFGARSTRMFNDGKFGLDDPILAPQMFDLRVPHLALIPHPPSFEGSATILSVLPRKEHDFEPVDANNPLCGLGRISSALRQVLASHYRVLRQKVHDQREAESNREIAQELIEDKITKSHLHRLKFYFGRLDCPTDFDVAFMLWCLIQRICLELDARISWVCEVGPVFRNVTRSLPTRNSIVGAFVEHAWDAENLTRAGVPCWLVRRVGEEQGVKILKWLEATPFDERWLENCPADEREELRRRRRVRFVDATPRHPTIFTGRPTDLERYHCMAVYIQERVSPGRLVKDTIELSSRPSEAGPSRTSASLGSKPERPYKRPVHQTRAGRNKFVDVNSPLMPRALAGWMEGLKQAGTDFDQNAEPERGINRGYFLPDPNTLIVGGDREQGFFAMYLKIRAALHYRVTSSRCEPLITKLWRDLLGLAICNSTRTDTQAAKRRSDVKAKLVKCLKESNSQGDIDLSNLHTAPIAWEGQTLTPPISDGVAQEILWELFEVNFRSELLALDCMAYKLKPEGFETADGADFNELDASNTEDRRIRVLSYIPHINGRLIPESVQVGRTGFASKDLEERRLALWALNGVMQTWTRTTPMTENMRNIVSKIEPSKTVSREDVDLAEFRIAFHYTINYVNVFMRAPLLPHGL